MGFPSLPPSGKKVSLIAALALIGLREAFSRILPGARKRTKGAYTGVYRRSVSAYCEFTLNHY